MNIAILVCLIIYAAYGLIIALMDSYDHGFNIFRFIFLVVFYLPVDI